MTKLIVLLSSVLLFAGSAQSREMFSLEDYYRLKRSDQRRFLGALNNFYIEFEKAQRKHGFKDEVRKKRYFRYYNSMNFIFDLLVREAVAEGQKLCVNNGVIAEVSESECKSGNNSGVNSNWGFDMASHLKGLTDAGLKVSCDPSASTSGEAPPQGCGLLGLQKDLTLACSQNRTEKCIEQGDMSMIQSVMGACRKAKDNDFKEDAEIKVGSEVRKIKCQPIYEHMEKQMQMFAFTCHSEMAQDSFSTRLYSSVKNICEKTTGQLENITKDIDGFGNINSISGPQTDSQKNLRIIGNQMPLSNDDFGGSLNQCLSSKKYNVSQYALEETKEKEGDKAVSYLHKTKGAYIEETVSGGKVKYTCAEPCKKEEKVKTTIADVDLFEKGEEESFDTGVSFAGLDILEKLKAADQLESDEKKKEAKEKALKEYTELTRKFMKSLSEFSKGCHLATPIIKDAELRSKYKQDILKATAEAAKVEGKEDTHYCSVVQSNDALDKVQVDSQKEKPSEVSPEEWQKLGKEICQKIDSGGELPAEQTVAATDPEPSSTESGDAQ